MTLPSFSGKFRASCPGFVLCAAIALASQPLRAERLSTAVLQLDARGVDSNSARVVGDAVGDGLVRTGKVQLIERAQIATILQEQGFQQSGACDGGECSVKIGQLLGARRIVSGSVSLLDGQHVLSLRMVDVETGEIVGTSQRSAKGSLAKSLDQLVPLAVEDLVGVRPARRIPSWAYWTGGIALVGAGAAAVLLLSDDDSPSAAPASQEDPTSSIKVVWK